AAGLLLPGRRPPHEDHARQPHFAAPSSSGNRDPCRHAPGHPEAVGIAEETMNEYLALFEPAEEGGFVVTFPDFDWGVTQGDTEESAVEMAADALEMIIADHIQKGQPLPRTSKPRGR